MIELKQPSVELFPEFQEFMDEMVLSGEKLWEPYTPGKGESAINFVHRLLLRNETPEPPLVPETIYWATSSGHVVGRISLRHELNGNLSKVGGHIGYEVGPSHRRKGVATEMLRQILLTQKAKEIGKLLLTCAPDNLASNKTIISNGGRLTQTIYVELIKADRNHYWIDLS